MWDTPHKARSHRGPNKQGAVVSKWLGWQAEATSKSDAKEITSRGELSQGTYSQLMYRPGKHGYQLI